MVLGYARPEHHRHPGQETVIDSGPSEVEVAEVRFVK